MMAQVGGKKQAYPLLYNFSGSDCSTTYEGDKKYFCHPLL